MKNKIRDMLVKAARNGKVVTYTEVGNPVGLFMSDPSHRDKMSDILCEISTEEYNMGRPLLSAVVVYLERNSIPGSGFFKLAKKLGKQQLDEDDDIFYSKELKRVFDMWMMIDQ